MQRDRKRIILDIGFQFDTTIKSDDIILGYIVLFYISLFNSGNIFSHTSLNEKEWQDKIKSYDQNSR
jgi:hypothetical protein